MPYWTALKYFPDWFGLEPCVKWPPASKDIPKIVSPGLMSAKNTAWLACAPEWGWTLA